MADSKITIDLSGVANAQQGQTGSTFDSSAISDLKKALDDLANNLKELPNSIEKVFSGKGQKDNKELNDLQMQTQQQSLNNARTESEILTKKLQNVRNEDNNNRLFKKGIETFFGSQVLNRLNSITNAAITTNPLANPVQRATQIASAPVSAGADALALGVGAINPIAGILTYFAGSLFSNVYQAFKGQQEQEAYNRYFLSNSYLTRSIAKNADYNPNKNPYFAQIMPVAQGYAQFGGAVNEKQATLIASLGNKIGLNPTDSGSYKQLGGIIAQLQKSGESFSKAIDTVERNVENFGGGLQNANVALALIQTGAVTAKQAFNMAYQNPHFGQAFAARADQFATTPYLQRFQQEIMTKALTGVDLEKLYTGTPTQQNAQMARLRSLQKKATFSTESFDFTSFGLSTAGVEGPNNIARYTAHQANKQLLNDPHRTGNIDPATQTALNAQRMEVKATNVVLNTLSGEYINQFTNTIANAIGKGFEDVKKHSTMIYKSAIKGMF